MNSIQIHNKVYNSVWGRVDNFVLDSMRFSVYGSVDIYVYGSVRASVNNSVRRSVVRSVNIKLKTYEF